MYNYDYQSVKESIELCNKIFVYGTLKHGYHNHRVIADGTPLGNATLQVPNLAIFDTGPFPAVSYTNQELPDDYEIHGELYEVDFNTFVRCDRLEGYPSFYDREIVFVRDKDGNMVEAWVYTLDMKDSKYIKSGKWGK